MDVCSLINGLPQLVMKLHSDVAIELQKKMGKISSRVVAGDTTIIPEILANAASDLPVHAITREALEAEQQKQPKVLGKRPAPEPLENSDEASVLAVVNYMVKRDDRLFGLLQDEKEQVKMLQGQLRTVTNRREAESIRFKRELKQREEAFQAEMTKQLEKAHEKANGPIVLVSDVIRKVKDNWELNEDDCTKVGELARELFRHHMGYYPEKSMHDYKNGPKEACVYYRRDWALIELCVRKHFNIPF